jgi:hypothetical protein
MADDFGANCRDNHAHKAAVLEMDFEVDVSGVDAEDLFGGCGGASRDGFHDGLTESRFLGTEYGELLRAGNGPVV